MDFSPALAAAALYAGLNALLLMALAARTIRLRLARGVSLGDGGDPALLAAIRAHGNAAETMPTALLLIALAALAGAPPVAIHILGLLLTAGRTAHALALCAPGAPMQLRVAGMAMTFACLGLSALGLIAHGLGAL